MSLMSGASASTAQKRLTEGMGTGHSRQASFNSRQFVDPCRAAQSCGPPRSPVFKARYALNAKIPFQDVRSRSDLAG